MTDFRVGDYARRKNGTVVRVVKSIRNGRLYLQAPGKSWYDWESIDNAVLVCRRDDHREMVINDLMGERGVVLLLKQEKK